MTDKRYENQAWKETVVPCPDGDSCPDARRYGAIHPRKETKELREAMEVMIEASMGAMPSIERSLARATIRAFLDTGLPFYEAAMEMCTAWDNGDVSDKSLDPFDQNLRTAYRAMDRGEKGET